jgi:hypothetical protein
MYILIFFSVGNPNDNRARKRTLSQSTPAQAAGPSKKAKSGRSEVAAAINSAGEVVLAPNSDDMEEDEVALAPNSDDMDEDDISEYSNAQDWTT